MLKITIWLKLMAIAFAFILPISVLLFFTIKGINYDIAFEKWEHYGNEYQRSLESLLQHLAMQRLLVNGQANEEGTYAAQLTSLHAQIDANLDALEEVDNRLAVALKTTDEEMTKRGREHYRVKTLKDEWQMLKSGLPSLSLEASDEKMRHLIEDVRALIAHVGDTSNLILDPDLDSYYLMDITLLALPQMQDRLQEVIVYGNAALLRKRPTPEDKLQLAVYIALLQEVTVHPPYLLERNCLIIRSAIGAK